MRKFLAISALLIIALGLFTGLVFADKSPYDYDTNGSDVVDLAELRQALRDYLAGDLSQEGLLLMVALYLVDAPSVSHPTPTRTPFPTPILSPTPTATPVPTPTPVALPTPTPTPTATPVAEQTAPTITTLYATSHTSFHVRWTPPANTTVYRYHVAYRRHQSTDEWTVHEYFASARYANAYYLTEGQEYVVYVRAVLSFGPGPWSEPRFITPVRPSFSGGQGDDQ